MLDQYKGSNSIQVAKFKQDIQSGHNQINDLTRSILQKEQQMKSFEEKIKELTSVVEKNKNAGTPKNREELMQMKDEIRNFKNKKEDILQEVIKYQNEKVQEDEKIQEMRNKEKMVILCNLSFAATTKN